MANEPRKDFVDLTDLPRALDDNLVPLIMAEYVDLTASMRANEELGERRLDAFLTVIAAVTAAIGLASGRFESDTSSLLAIAAAAASLLLIFGLMTLRRIMGRNLTTTEYLNALRRIRAFLVQGQPEAARILAFPPERKPVTRKRDSLWGLEKAGLLETIAAVNCGLIMVVAVASMQLLGEALVLSLLGGILVAVLAWLAQMKWAKETYSKLTETREGSRRANLDSWQRWTATR